MSKQLFDADAEQRVPFLRNGKEVAHIFAPLTDEVLMEFDRKIKRFVRLQDRVTSTETDTIEASLWLWDKLCVRVEGYGKPGEELPADWKARISDATKISAVEEALLLNQILQAETATDLMDEGWDVKDDAYITLGVLFAGTEIHTSHVLRMASANHLKTYQKILGAVNHNTQSNSLKTTTIAIPPRAAKLAALYDDLVIHTDGYSGRVPMHHKVTVVNHHLTAEQASLAGN